MEAVAEKGKITDISFIIPVYNSETTIEICVKQLLEISELRTEIILVDDGSTDQSGNLCNRLAAVNPNIICIHQKNQGVSSARNRGLELAKGVYIQFIDNDDTVETENLKTIIQQMVVHPEVDMAIFGLSFDYYHKEALYRRDQLEPALNGIKPADEWINHLQALYQSNSLSPVWNKIFKRSILMEHGLILRKEMFLYEDLEYSLRSMACCDKIAFWNDIIYHYRQSEDEGNAGRRLMRINHIPKLIFQIEDALKYIFEEHPCTSSESDMAHLLDNLYKVLAREKISFSSKEDIAVICEDYSRWREANDILSDETQDRFTEWLCNKKVMSFIAERFYVKYRHKAAVIVKAMKAAIERKS